MGFVKKNIDNVINNYSQADVYLRAQEVINGKWGNGPERIQKLLDAGYNPTEVQTAVNQMLSGNNGITETIELTPDPAPENDGTIVNENNQPIENIDDNKIIFKHEQSNTLANMARGMGFTEEQVKLAVGISRWETGNYQYLAGGNNYGGVTGTGDAGSHNQYANYSTPEIGMRAYLENLKRNYIDLGLTTPEACAKKYLGYVDESGNWVNGVYGCMQ